MQNLPALATSSLLLDVSRFEHAQRVSKMLSSSTMVPAHFRENVGNCVIALNYADRVGIDPFMAMQKMYIIHGKPAIETQLQIALFNKSGRFDSLKYKVSGEGDEKSCIAYATIKESGEVIEGPPVSIAMSKAEGWYGKSGSKWKTLPDLMLRYRAAAFFIRLYAPETTLGLQTTEEVYESADIIDITPEQEVMREIEKESASIEIDIPASPVEQAPEPTPEPEQQQEQQPEVSGPGF